MKKNLTAPFLLSFATLGLLASALPNSPAPPQNKDKTASSIAKTKKNPKDNADMIFIPAGKSVMGSNDYDDEKPIHKVTLDGYYIYRTAVTVAQYLKFCEETGHKKPSSFDFNPNWSKRDHPIVNVSYNDALAYCAWAGGRLPTEAEWEKAASWDDAKKQKRKFPWGDEFDTSKLWCSTAKVGDAGGTKSVGSFPSGESAYGVWDMAGNVWQWCSDYYDKDFYSSRLATDRNAENQSVGEKASRVFRGGSWNDDYMDDFRCSNRKYGTPIYRSNDCGFRCVLRSDS